jgi:hypothetical protein
MSETLSKHRSRDEQSQLDQGLEFSFPASDPVSVTNPSTGVKIHTAGPKRRKIDPVFENARELLDLEYRPVRR